MNSHNFDKARQLERENMLEAQRGEARTTAQAAYDMLRKYRDIGDYGTQRVSISVKAGEMEEFFEAVDSMECPLKEPEAETEENDADNRTPA